MPKVLELVRNKEEVRPVNSALVDLLRQLTALAEAGDIQAAVVAYVSDGVPLVCYEADGFETELSCAARQIDDEMRAIVFAEGE